jgi:hypothetical protein
MVLKRDIQQHFGVAIADLNPPRNRGLIGSRLRRLILRPNRYAHHHPGKKQTCATNHYPSKETGFRMKKIYAAFNREVHLFVRINTHCLWQLS